MARPDPTGGLAIIPVLGIVVLIGPLIVNATLQFGVLGFLTALGLIAATFVVSAAVATFIYFGIPAIIAGIALGTIRLIQLTRRGATVLSPNR